MTTRSKTHCVHGHAFTPENTYLYRGAKRCRECHRKAARVNYHQRRGNSPAEKAERQSKERRAQAKQERYQEALKHLTKDQLKRLFYI